MDVSPKAEREAAESKIVESKIEESEATESGTTESEKNVNTRPGLMGQESAIINKIRSTGGASLAIALVYFLLCATVGSVVLAAAMANISHVKSEKINENSYLAVMSAGQVLKKNMEAAAGEWSLDHGEQGTQADNNERVGFKHALLGERNTGSTGRNMPDALSESMYQVYLNCVEEDNGLRVPADESDKREKGVVISLAFRLEDSRENDQTMLPVNADITFTPDYVVMDSGDAQQLQVKVVAALYIDGESARKGQYYLRMTANGVVHYMLDETITEVEGSDGSGEDEGGDEGDGGDSEPDYIYEYTSRAVISSDRPIFSGAQRQADKVTGEDAGTDPGGDMDEEAE